MTVGERVFDLTAEPVKGTAVGAWDGLKKGAIVIGVTAAVLSGWGVLALGASLWLAAPVAVVAGGVGFAAGGAGGSVAGGALGGLGGAFNGIRKFITGRDSEPNSKESQLEQLRQQAASETAQTAELRRQHQQRAAATDGANPGAATDNVAKFTARQAEAASRATSGRG
jgi:hypothetical protein